MKKIISILAFISILPLLSACISPDQADAKMQRGCIAGIKSLIEPKEILETKSVNFSNELLTDGMYRRATFKVMEQDGWAELEKEYSCLFLEQWGPLKTSHTASLMQVDLGGKIVGNKDGKLVGELEDFLKLTRVVDAAMSN